MFDRFLKALGIAEENPGICVSKHLCTVDYLGNGVKVSIFLLNYLNLPLLTSI
jgi:hypothetical protein